jgi:DNA-binding transcriptional LysR family regulator
MDRLMSMEVFVATAQAGGFTAAARRLKLSPAMVGTHIRFLEARLGTPLISRTTRRQHLTDAGRAYLERCRQILAEVALAETSLGDSPVRPRGVLRLASPVTFGSCRLAALLPHYLRQYPDLKVDLTLTDERIDLVGGNFDAAFVIGRLPDSALVARPLASYPMVLAAAPAYLERHGTPKTPADLTRHNCLGFAHWDKPRRWALGRGRPVTIHSNFTASNGQALRVAALQGAGVVLQPELLLADDLAAGRLVPLLKAHAPRARPLQLVYQRQSAATPKLRSFIDFIIGRLREGERS